MKTIIITRKIMLILVVFGVYMPLFGAEPQLNSTDLRNTPITVNLIVDGTTELAGNLDAVIAWISGNLLDKLLQNGDQITIWSAGQSAEILYSQTIKDGEKENIKNMLQRLQTRGNAADFTSALRNAVSRSRNRICYTVLITASAAALSPTLSDSGADLIRFSRIEEYRGWRVLVIGLDINSRVRQAASAYLAGM